MRARSVKIDLPPFTLVGATTRSGLMTRPLFNAHLALVETARGIVTGLPERNDIAPGSLSGESAGYRWRVDVLPFHADFIDPDAAWLPQTVVVRVQSPAGKILQLNTVRLRRKPTQ